MTRWAKYDTSSGKITEILTEAPTPPQQQTFGIIEISDDDTTNVNVGDSVEGNIGIARVVPGKGRGTQEQGDKKQEGQRQTQR